MWDDPHAVKASHAGTRETDAGTSANWVYHFSGAAVLSISSR
jgi:hypothetical protein